MSEFTITIKNYRSFNTQIQFDLNEGTTYFIGPNNVGKSSLLKIFYEFRNILKNLFQKINPTNPIPYTGTEDLNQCCFEEIFHQNSANEQERVFFTIESSSMILNFIITPNGPKNQNKCTTEINLKLTTKGDVNTATEHFFKIQKIFDNIFYLGTFQSNAHGKYFDALVGKEFVDKWNEWALGQGPISQIKKIESLTEELRILLGFKKLSINRHAKGNDLLIQNENGFFNLRDMGNGISQLITTLANVTFQKPSIILIDEPETSLHPKLQQEFIAQLASKSSYGLLATTHSIGLARSTGDNIYSLLKDKNNQITLKPFGQQYESTIQQTMYEMGFNQFVELGGNKILLVEGRTDVLSFREILRKFNIEQEVIIIPLGGGEFLTKEESKISEQLSEIKRFNLPVFTIIDSNKTAKDSTLAKNLITFKKACDRLGITFFSTEYHSTENYITQSAINEVLGLQAPVKQLEAFDNPTQNNWGRKIKEKNWLMFSKMERKDFKNTELEKFIEEKIKLNTNTEVPVKNKELVTK